MTSLRKSYLSCDLKDEQEEKLVKAEEKNTVGRKESTNEALCWEEAQCAEALLFKTCRELRLSMGMPR